MEAAARAAATLRALPASSRWLLACDIDADGVAAAAVTAQALRKLGIRFTIRASRDKTAAGYRSLFEESWDGIIFLDKGSSHLALLAELAAPGARPVVVVDHHNIPPDPAPGVTLLNPRSQGIDGSREASASTTAVALALALCGDAALAWAPNGLAGAVGDMQDAGGWQGWNRDLVDRARKSGHLAPMLIPRLAGPDLAQAIARLEPPVAGLHGDVVAAAVFLDTLAIDRHTEVEDLDAETRTFLVSALLLCNLAAGEVPADPRNLMAEVDRHVPLGASLRQVYRTADACGREGQAATGIAYLMGDKGARADAQACLAKYRDTLSEALHALRQTPPTLGPSMQSAWTERPGYSGLVASLAMKEVVMDKSRPVAILARRPDGLVQVSTRGTHAQVAAGMDLGRACLAAAAKVACEGGGHPIAAGAVVPEDAVLAFVAALDGELADQGFVPRLT